YPGHLGQERHRARTARVDLDDVHTAFKDDVLDVEESANAQCSSEVGGVANDRLDLRVRNGLGRIQGDAVTGGHTCTFDMFHDPRHQHIGPVAYGIDLDLRAFEVLVHQQWLLAGDLLGYRREAAQLLRPAADFHRSAAEDERRPHQHR